MLYSTRTLIRNGKLCSTAFQVVAEARAVILASGTLAPVSAVTRQLFPGADAAARLRHFSCGHIVAKHRLLALAVGAWTRPRDLRACHSSRQA